ncbi:MAG TPA: universal stress protein [Candidatus Limnocylindrales bacterium]
MRVLLAVDGSSTSESARRLVGSIDWPEGTVIEVAGAIEPIIESFGTTVMPMPPTAISPDTRTVHAIEQAVDDAAAALEGPGRIIRRAILDGRPATMIVDEAVAFRAELVVVGSRGLGPLKSMLLGSVSAEIVDHAPCPILVVRKAAFDTILLAVDGSPSAVAAATFLGACRFLAAHPIEVLSVAASSTHLPPVPLTGMSDAAFEADAVRVSESRRWTEAIAATAVEQLRSDGLHARWSISQGNPAHEIIEAARCFGCDLIVVGSRGHTGLTRIVLGSVARNVLLHTEASVLIVREPVRVRSAERVESAERSPVGQPVTVGTS